MARGRRKGSPAAPWERLRAPDEDDGLGSCPICGRPIVAGPSANRHHWRPRSKGGRAWSWLHRVCHRKIHSLWTEAELLRAFDTAEKILTAVDMQRFVRWVSHKHPEFYDGSADHRR